MADATPPDSELIGAPEVIGISAGSETSDLSEVARPTGTRADAEHLRTRLEQWFTDTLGADAEAKVGEVTVPDASGMSSDTVLFNATWNNRDGAPQTHRLVARLAPPAEAMPVFPRYDLALQA